MKRPLLLISAVLLVTIAAAIYATMRPDAGNMPTPVLIELFTSQGCSSCPPADALLHRIANDLSYAAK